MSREDRVEARLKETLEKLHYPRSRVYRGIINDARMYAIIEIVKERDFYGMEDWDETKKRSREIARQMLDDLVRKRIPSLEKN